MQLDEHYGAGKSSTFSGRSLSKVFFVRFAYSKCKIFLDQKPDDDNNSASDADNDDSEEDDTFYCPACEKAFKTAKAYENHERSKKHKDNVLSLKTHMAEDELNLLGLNDKEEAAAYGSGTKKSKKAKKKEKNDENDDGEKEEKNASEQEEKQRHPEKIQRLISEEIVEVGHKIERIRERRESGCIEEMLNCSTCNEKFTSRNKLFSHLKETNHAAMKNVGGGGGGGSGAGAAKNKAKKKKK